MRSLLFCNHPDPARRYALTALGWLLALSSSASATESVPALAAEHAVVITEHTSLYLVDARNVSQMRRQLDARGPVTRFGHPAAALTRHTIEVEYVLSPSAGACGLANVQVRTRIEMHLPEWKPKRTPSAEFSEQWQRVAHALGEHETGHRDNGVRASHALLQRLQALPVAADCHALALDALLVRASLMQELQRIEEAYDLKTRFSRLQLPPRADEDAKRAERDVTERQRARRLLNGF